VTAELIISLQYISSGASPDSDQRQAIAPSSSITRPCVTSGAVQGNSALEGTRGGRGDAVIDITIPVDTEMANVGDVDDSTAL
jgi:hypothetical protein